MVVEGAGWLENACPLWEDRGVGRSIDWRESDGGRAVHVYEHMGGICLAVSGADDEIWESVWVLWWPVEANWSGEWEGGTLVGLALCC